ncbi:hypothetical protein NCLIV_004980 [Neospora caninum Liverpool]|uniref:Uncharacterized protein n=1 Tax=Neospora caninum (strain Liverpool) TaxID=572307 RepID=F0V8I1_NEOCL|nr:hypothetical protein NCLIV_004980 [Neospora caninum Liverpool]CBZ50022.1 hypothetical protein NCLIV_004980 [Neospora caninum Liverpool]|eukprot:XP_003880057.1 hypothetical protein NCLIV_004980 [Neospora caninum Liverpool]
MSIDQTTSILPAPPLPSVQALQADRPVSALPALREAKAQQEAEREVLERNVAEKRKALDAVEKKKSLLLAEVARLKRKLEAQAEAENFDLASEDLNEEQRRIEAEEEELEKVKERLWGVQEDLRLHEAMKRTTRDREGHGPEDNERTAADASRAEKAVALRKETAEKREELRKFEASILRKQQWLSHLSLEIEKVLDRTSLRFRPSPTHALPSPCSTAPPHSAGVSALSSPSTFLAREPEMLSSCLPARKDARGAAHRRPRDTAGDLEKRALRALAETAGEKTAESESRRKREGETPSSFIGRQLGEEDELFELEAEVTACCQDLPVLEELLQERLARACLLAGQAEPPFARSPLALSPRSSPRAASTGTLAGAVDPKEGQLEIEKEEDRGREAEEHRAKEAVTTQQGTPAMPHTRADPVCLQVNAALSGCMYTPEVLPEKQTKQRTGRSPLSMASPRPLSRTSSLGGDPREKTDGFREEDLTTTEAPSGACTPPLLNHASVTRGSTFKAEATASLANLPSRGAAECASAPASSTPPAASGVYVQRKFPANQPVSSPVRRSRLCFSRRSDSSKESPSSASPKSQVETLPISRNSSSAAWTSRSERRSPARSRSLSETLSEDGREGRGDAAQAAKGEKLERALDAGEAARSGEENRFSFEAEARLKTACTQRREPRRTEAAEDQPWNALLAWASSWTGEAGLRSPRERKAEGRTPSVSSSQRGHRRALPPLRSCSSSSSSSLSPTPSACFSPSGSSFSSASSFGPERVARGDGTRTVLREKRENVEADGALDAPAETMWETLGPATAKRDENVVKNLGKLLALLEALPDVDLRAPKASSEKAVAQKNARARRDGPGERGQRRQATKETGTKTWNRRGAQEKRRGSCDVPDSRNSSRCPSTSPLPSPLPSSSCSSAVCTEVVTGTALLPEARRETQSGRRGRFAPECVAFQASSFARVSEKGEERREGQSDGGARAQEANTSAGDRLRAVAGEERPGGGGALHREEEEDAPKEGNTPRGEDAPKQEEKGARKPEEEEARKQEEEDARKQEEEDARKQEEEDAAREKADRAEEGSSVREEEIGAERGEGERVEEDGSGESPRGTATEEEAERSREEEGPRKDSGASSLFSRASGAHCEPENGGRGMGAQHVLEETLEATGTLQSDCGSDGEQTGEDKLENGMRSAGGFADGRGGDALNGNGSKEAAEETREGRFLAEGAPILQGGEDEREQALATLHERGGRESAGEEAEKAARHKEKEHAETGEDGRRGEATCGAEASPWTRGEREETNAKTEREEEEAEGEENRAVVEEGEEAAFIATEAGERFEQDGAQDAVAGQDDRGEEEEKRTRKLRREEAGEEARRDSRFCATQPEREGEREARRDRASDGEEEGTQKRDREEERRGRKEEKEQKVSVSGGPVKDLVAPAFSETIARAESPGKGEVDASCLSLVGCEEIKDASAETPPRTPLRTPVAGRHDSSGRPQSPSCLSFSSLSSRRGSDKDTGTASTDLWLF